MVSQLLFQHHPLPLELCTFLPHDPLVDFPICVEADQSLFPVSHGCQLPVESVRFGRIGVAQPLLLQLM